MPKLQPKSIKEKAITYRKQGYSYNMISQELGLAKSTLSGWLQDIPYAPNKTVLERIQYGPARSGEIAHNRKVKEILEMRKLAKRELGSITKRDLWILGIGLYLGEGAKLNEASQISNSDPRIIKIMMKWFRKICGVPTRNFNLAVYTYPDNNIEDTVRYWAKITGVPRTQFGKTQIDTRTNKVTKKKRKLPYGTLRISIQAKGHKEFGVRLHRRILGWLETTIEQA